ncbi:hypothetical protein G7085_09390 [Tessaracoccus sp. HDW20]|uniref:glycosyl hydrolase family 95 catalytic domain-containing protein n=1 Tax=Tessaracoccus coleopterorum TaxID=2714950 RepID=UPI0018D4853B|nr:hypothetical protein [Tessaracoccus coleopterorum]NHB84748.1 hypothetical protein [Tessaracoccus coleopterorum]
MGRRPGRLDPVQIGGSGQIREWYEETTFGRAQAGDLPETDIPNWNAGYRPLPHRHLSHLVGLFPGTLITPGQEDVLAAAKVSLEQRGFATTGWGKAHRLSLWARALDAEMAHLALTRLVGPPRGIAGIMDNLLAGHGQGDDHDEIPLMQVEANFGLTAGMAEMLLQSHLGRVRLLPALPEAWAEGRVSGLRARGNFEIDLLWEGGALVSAAIASGSGNDLTLSYPGIDGYALSGSDGAVVAPHQLGVEAATYRTVAGGRYRLVRAAGS